MFEIVIIEQCFTIDGIDPKTPLSRLRQISRVYQHDFVGQRWLDMTGVNNKFRFTSKFRGGQV